MKKISDLIRPFLGIIFGALLMLYYLNFIGPEMPAEYLALGIIAVTFAAYYLGSAIVMFLLGDRLPEGIKKIFLLLSVVCFPTLIFVENLLFTIALRGQLGTTGWIIMSASLAGSIAFATLYSIAVFTKIRVIERLAFLFGAIFFLSLVLSLLFSIDGAATAIDDIPLVTLAIYAIYSSMLFNALLGLGKKEAE